MKLAVGYIRVSTTVQANDGMSLETQVQRIKDFCRAKDYELIEICRDEGFSGRKLNRPGLRTALSLVCDNKAILVVYSLSRLSRSLIDCVSTFNQIDRCGGGLVSITESQIDTTGAMGKLIFSIMSALGEFEYNIISERTRSVLRHKEALGEKLGGPIPYGYGRDGKMLIPYIPEQVILGYMIRRHAEGASTRIIRDELSEAGISTRCGSQWNDRHIRKIIRREKRVSEIRNDRQKKQTSSCS